MGGPVAFVGRERELSRLLGALGGGARLVLVTGDAGVGKTRFAGEGMSRAGAGGMVVLRGECLPLAGALPLLPVASALGELAGLGDGKVLAAALGAAPGFVRGEVGRLLPQVGPGGGPGWGGQDGRWRRERLFAAVAELLDAAAAATGAGVGLVVEDVHWADGETLDLLTFLSRPGRRGGVCVVTCRGDEAPLAAPVAGWLAQARGAAGVEEIPLGPLSRVQVAAQVAALAGGRVPTGVVDELFARAEGNPFFTEQLVAAALAGGAPGAGLRIPPTLPARLAGLLEARASRCAGDARAVLDALAVADRPLEEGLLGEITGLEPEVVRRGLRELAAARLLAEETTSGRGHRPRHALLAEAVTSGLLSGERAMLHERTARALQMAGGQTLAAEVAGHWQAAGCPAEELPARVAAAGAAERVFGYAEAAAHWQRALELWPDVPDVTAVAGIDLPRVYVRAIDAVQMGGDRGRAGELAEEAYRRFAGHTDAAIAAVIHLRTAVLREYRSPAAAKPLIETALRLFADCPASAEKAEAWFRYGANFWFHAEGRLEASRTALNRALDIAEAAGATVLSARVLSWLALNAFLRGHLDEGFSSLQRGTAQADASQEPQTVMWLASYQSEALLSLGRFDDAAKTAQQALAAGRRAGLPASFSPAAFLAATAAEALLAVGRAAEAARLIDPLTTGPPSREQWATHQARADIDLLRGDTQAAARRQQQISSFSFAGSIDNSRRRAQRAAELALWAGRPGDALAEVQQVLQRFATPDLTILCGRLLAAGMRACADLAEQARARRDAPAAEAATDAADGLALWAGQMGGAPFTDHPFVATIPAERTTWDAERTRLAGPSDPAVWAGAVKAWQDQGSPHWAGYAWWRQAQAQLDAGQPATAATAALRAAAVAARGHSPLLAQVHLLAERARIPLDAPALPGTLPSAQAPVPYGLTGRELTVLRLLAAGRTNAQIGAELFISPRTAGVHVTNILRKLGVTGRVQAAAVAERAGLLDAQA